MSQLGLRRQVFHAYEPTARDASGVRFCPRCGTVLARRGHRGRVRPTCPRCDYIHYRNPAPGVAVVVVDDDRVVLGRRVATATFGARWALPAGFIEFEEDYLTAARREVREETGLDVAVTGILDVTFNYLTDALHALVVVMAARPAGGTLCAGDDFSAVQWFPLAGPYPPLAYEADAQLLRRLQHGGGAILPVDPRYALPPVIDPPVSQGGER